MNKEKSNKKANLPNTDCYLCFLITPEKAMDLHHVYSKAINLYRPLYADLFKD
jgi:hypothetical protein